MFQNKNILQVLFLIFILLSSSTISAQLTSKGNCDNLIKLGIKALEKNDHKHSLELLFQANSIAKNNLWYDLEFTALNNIGTNYYRLFEYGNALNYYQMAYTIATKKLTKEDEIKVLNNIGILYYEEKKCDQAKNYFDKVYAYAKKNKQNIKAAAAAINLGTLSIETKNINLAKVYYTEALSFVKKQPQYIVLAKGGLANCYLLQGNTVKARQIAEYLLKNTKDLDFYHADIELLLIIAKTYLKENKLDISESYITKILIKKPNLETKIKLFTLLSEINSKRKSFELALQYKDSIYNGMVAMNEIKNDKLFANSKIKFEIQNYKNQLLLK